MAGRAEFWIVTFDLEAVLDFEKVKGRGERRAVFNALDKLRSLGPSLPSPHAKSLKGEPRILELRPRQGNSPVRVLYCRIGGGFVVLAVAFPKDRFDDALSKAKFRLRRYS